ncbi:Putative alpha,alpha-trehalose-phosphate synthase [UDP-forming] 106 kDa subunit [Psilocybe cubensis]|uniref:Alpha,alpha-trehalose-phosphate synthase [UDP-forming] 106 kDa subunit n=2 Tax=Psilocybe cubensis TaxID=181762 RepID=A0ACB8GNY3_PSICU|nr:Putative alpha,alpha-trehalose-phosphate synthase [UDP-forming] 106 kDa subunit [Psilocybe cubensis]KAH9476749.1 Putative alpha,alpha-trehalose-phosphate synthase [UDP-forming] 106 kDa subunit [Psilocybe cubensis]
MTSFRNHRIVIASLFLPTTAVLTYSSPPTPDHEHETLAQVQARVDAEHTIPAVSSRLAAVAGASAAGAGAAAEGGGAASAAGATATAAGAGAGAATAKKPLKPALVTRGSAVSGAGAGAGGASGQNQSQTAGNTHTRQSSLNVPLKSIVDDLKDKSRLATPSARSPTNETTNPFTKLTRFAADSTTAGDAKDTAHTPSITSPLPRKHQTTHPDTSSVPRLRRNKSRSTSRRATSSARAGSVPTSPSVDSNGGSMMYGGASGVPAWHMEPNPHCNGGLKNAVESVGERMKRKLWVGTLGTPTDGFGEELRRDIDARMVAQRQSLPVWIPDDEFQSCYDEFCHQVLWPCLHYAVPDAPKTKQFYESASYAQYLSVNQRFAAVIINAHQEGDIIWVNDYHLLLLPLLLRMSLTPGMPTSVSPPSSGNPHSSSISAPSHISGLPPSSSSSNPFLITRTSSENGNEGERRTPSIPPSTPIGFFMHVAFPSSEIFRCLSVRKDLLRGMLGADLVGFQTGSYARHWRQTVSRILSFEALPRGIQVPEGEGMAVGELDVGLGGGGGAGERKGENVQRGRSGAGGRERSEGEGARESKEGRVRDGVVERGRFVDVGVFPMGIDVRQLHIRRREPEVAEWVQVLKQRYAGMKLVVGRDKLDEIQGVRHKLVAFETFLEKYPQYINKVVLIQIALQTSSPNEQAATSSGITEIISRINARFSTLTYTPIVFLHTQDLTFSQYLALLEVADAFVVTSLREGMALRTHEFVECQEGKDREVVEVVDPETGERKEVEAGRHGVLVLSEFTGSYSYSGFRSCIAVNPWDARGTARAIWEALSMGREEARSRWEDLHNHVTTQTAQTFVNSFLNRCIRANTEHTASLLDDVGSGPTILRPLPSPGSPPLSPSSFGPNETSVSVLVGKFKHSRKRMIFVDFEGTLWRRDLSRAAVLADEGEDAPLPEEVERAVSVLGRLAEDTRRNEVWLLSGLKVRGVLEAVARRVPRVGIVAENGCFIKTRGGGLGSGEWINMVSNFNLTWKSSCLEILNYFTERTPGSFIEERQASMVWRYWSGPSTTSSGENPDRQWAQRQAAEAQNHIFDSLGERYGLRIIPGRNSFLVLPNNVSRSTAVGAILHPGGVVRGGHGGGGHHRHHSHSHSHGHGHPMSPSASDISTSLGLSNLSAFNSDGTLTSPTVDASSFDPSTSSLHGSSSSGSGDGAGGGVDVDMLLAVSSDEKLLRRLNEFEGAETVSTSGKGTDAKWRLESEESGRVLGSFVGV